MSDLVVARRAYLSAVRATLRALPRKLRCDPACLGWIISTSDKYGERIELCDECARTRRARKLPEVSELDVQALPEAWKAWLREIESVECMFCDARAYQCETGDPDGCYHCDNGHMHREK